MKMDSTEMDASTRSKVRQMYGKLKENDKDIPDMLDIENITAAIRAAGKTV